MIHYKSKSNKILNQSLMNKIDTFLNLIEELYPRKIIIYFKRDHENLTIRCRTLRKAAGYSSTYEFFSDYGFCYYDINNLTKQEISQNFELNQALIEIDKKRDEKRNSIINNIDVSKYTLLPLENFYFDNNWHPMNVNIKITNNMQEVINSMCNKLLKYYPQRIVVKLYYNYHKFCTNVISKVKKYLMFDNYNDLLEAFGFICVDKKTLSPNTPTQEEKKNDELKPLSDFYYDDSWHCSKTEEIISNINKYIDEVLDIVISIYPNRIIKNFDILEQIPFVNVFFKSLYKRYFKSVKSFLTEYGFLVSKSYPEENVYLPDFIYSKNKDILYKVFTQKIKFSLDENLKVIKTGALNSLNVEQIDLSSCSKNQVFLEDNAISDCLNLKSILNYNSLKILIKGSINNCPNFDLDKFYNKYYNINVNKNNSDIIYQYYILNQLEKNYEVIDVLITNKIFYPGTLLTENSSYQTFLVLELNELTDNLTTIPSNSNIYYDFDNLFSISSQNIQDKNIMNSKQIDIVLNQIAKNDKKIKVDFAKICSYYLNNNFSPFIKRMKHEFGDFKIPIFDNNEFIEYKSVNEDVIFNDTNKLLFDSKNKPSKMYKHLINTNPQYSTYNIDYKRKAFAEAILSLNFKQSFLAYPRFIDNPIYIDTFLTVHNADPIIFINSEFLRNNKQFLLALYKNYPYTDIKLINSELFKDESFMKKILSLTKRTPNYELLLERCVKDV